MLKEIKELQTFKIIKQAIQASAVAFPYGTPGLSVPGAGGSASPPLRGHLFPCGGPDFAPTQSQGGEPVLGVRPAVGFSLSPTPRVSLVGLRPWPRGRGGRAGPAALASWHLPPVSTEAVPHWPGDQVTRPLCRRPVWLDVTLSPASTGLLQQPQAQALVCAVSSGAEDLTDR